MEEITLPELERLAKRIPGGFFIYRASTSEEILFINDVMLDIFGCQTLEEFKELTGYTFPGMVHPDDLEAVEASINQQVTWSGKKLDYVEYRITRRDGSVRWVDDYGRLVHTEKNGDLFYVFIRDITEVRAARRESIRRARVIEGLSVEATSIYLLDLVSGSMRPYRLQNETFQRIVGELGIAPDETPDWPRVLSAYARRFVIPEDQALYLREISKERILERLRSERHYTVTYRCPGQDETSPIYMEMSIVRIDDNDLLRNAVMGYRDVTSQIVRVKKEMQEKMDMQMALEQEKNANEAKSAFLFSVSHDIRTPMNAIMGFTDLAKRHMNDPERLRDYLGKVDEANHHLLALIDDLLEMSRLDYGRVEIKTEPLDLARQINMALDMFKPQIEEKSLTLLRDIAIPQQPVCLDGLRFRRIIGNIVGNAVKFTPAHGEIKVTVRQKRLSDSGYARYEIVVEDNGIGMTEEFMKRMFESFEREESATKTGYLGTGLGLTITKRLLDIMGGSISATSKKGEGSSFVIDLPLKLADKETSVGEEFPLAEDMRKAAGEYRILLVEDIDVNRILAETMLSEAGFLVESVPDGSDAVEAIRRHRPWYYDVVLMDIQMPVMNGYEATRLIRALGREDTRDLPIIALSANAREQDRLMSVESGMNAHVAKPFDIAQLVAIVNEQIAASRRG